MSASKDKNKRIEPEQVFRLSPAVHLEAFQDGALILRLEDRHLFELNPTARDVLSLTDGHRKVVEIAQAIADTYPITQAEALQDATVLFQQLIVDGLVELVDA